MVATDEQLMQQFQTGHSRSFEILLQRYHTKLFHFIHRNCRNRARAEELVQDVFMRVVKSCESYRADAKFSTWIYTIARNICIDEARRQTHRRSLSLDKPLGDDDGATLGDLIDAENIGSDRRAQDKQFLLELAKALEALPEEQREVFELRQLQGLRFSEIAEIVNIPENTVKSRMRYALEGLRLHLERFHEK